MEPSKVELRKSYLKEQLDLARLAHKALRVSLESVGRFLPLANPHSEEIEEKLEVMTSRFARLTDILTQKVFRAIDAVELEDEGTLLDRFNRMEKRRVIVSASDWQDIRDLRNQIAHDYAVEEINSLRLAVIKRCPEVLAAFNAAEAYAKKIAP